MEQWPIAVANRVCILVTMTAKQVGHDSPLSLACQSSFFQCSFAICFLLHWPSFFSFFSTPLLCGKAWPTVQLSWFIRHWQSALLVCDLNTTFFISSYNHITGKLSFSSLYKRKYTFYLYQLSWFTKYVQKY